MAAGLAPLLTVAAYGQDQLARGTIETIIEGSTILEKLDWIPFAGLAYVKREESTLPNVHFRQVNASWNKSHASDTKTTWGVAIMGGEYEIDNYLARVVDNVEDYEQALITKFAKANRMRFEFEAFYGTGTDDGFVGLQEMVTQGFGQLDNKGGTPGALSLDDLSRALDLFRNVGMPDGAFLNRTLRRKITNLATASAGGTNLFEIYTDNLGRKVMSYDGVPFWIVEDGINGSNVVTPLLGFTEPTSTSSIYFVKFDSENVCGLLGANGHFSVQRFGELQAAPRRMGRIEWYPGLASFNKYGLVRLSNITNA